MKRTTVNTFSARVIAMKQGLTNRGTMLALVAALGMLVCCCALLGFAVRAWNPKAANPASIVPAMPLDEATLIRQTLKGSVEVEIVTLREWGFEPNSITRTKGRFFLAVNNQSQLTEHLTFSMANEVGTRLKEERLDWRARHRWNNFFELNPGGYRLTVLEHPEWICHFTVTAN